MTSTSVVGVSMGAGVALRLVQLYLDAFDRAVFLRASMDARPPHPPNLEILEEIGRLLNTRGAEAGKALLLQSSSYRSLHEASAASAASAAAQFDDPLAEQRFRRLLEMPASSPYGSPAELGEIGLPALVIGAPDDPLHPLATARTWAAGLRRAVYREVTSINIDAAAHRRGHGIPDRLVHWPFIATLTYHSAKSERTRAIAIESETTPAQHDDRPVFSEERRRMILELVAAPRPYAPCGILAAMVGVTEPTIRKDVADLDRARLLRRTHGGVIAIQALLRARRHRARRTERRGAKEAIARACLTEIVDGDAVFLDSGTTTAAIRPGPPGLSGTRRRDPRAGERQTSSPTPWTWQ